MSPSANDAPQFATAEYASSGDRCKSCNQPISGSYYRINGALACERCASQLQSQIPKDSHGAFVRAIMFGVGAAILGLILYAAFGIITGILIGYVSLAVGWIVGRAMRKGSNGVGGRRYQIAAAALTYAAVSMAAIPMALWQMKDHKPALARSAPAAPQISDDQNSSSSSTAAEDGGSPAGGKPKMGFGAALGALALAGLASPFLELQDPVHGLIGLVILFVGMRFAWQQTAAAKLDILGPFYSRPEPAVPST